MWVNHLKKAKISKQPSSPNAFQFMRGLDSGVAGSFNEGASPLSVRTKDWVLKHFGGLHDERMDDPQVQSRVPNMAPPRQRAFTSEKGVSRWDQDLRRLHGISRDETQEACLPLTVVEHAPIQSLPSASLIVQEEVPLSADGRVEEQMEDVTRSSSEPA